MSVLFGNGNNTLQLKSIAVGGNLVVRAGDGDLQIRSSSFGDIAAVAVGGSLKVRTADGDQQIDLHELSVSADVLIKTGAGDDTVLISGQVGDDLIVKTMGGDDVVGISTAAAGSQFTAFLGELAVGDRSIIRLGSGNNRFEAESFSTAELKFTSKDGDDRVNLTNTQVFSNLLIDVGTADDNILINTTEIGGRFRLASHEGNDEVTVSQVNIVDRAFFELGAGQDQLRLNQVSALKVLGRLGDGNDAFEFLGPNVNGIVDGGNGEDSLAPVGYGGPRVRSFERLVEVFLSPGVRITRAADV